MVDRKELIAELNNLRTSIAALHNHKETTAYAAFTLNLASAAWVAGPSEKDAAISFLVLFGSIAIHMAMRFQLIQRKHCAQFYQVYTSAIRDVMQMRGEQIHMPVVAQSQWPVARPKECFRYVRLFVWTRTEAFYTADINYPTFSVVHDHIFRTSKIEASNPNSMIEVLPTVGGIGCILLIAANAYKFIPLFIDKVFKLLVC